MSHEVEEADEARAPQVTKDRSTVPQGHRNAAAPPPCTGSPRSIDSISGASSYDVRYASHNQVVHSTAAGPAQLHPDRCQVLVVQRQQHPLSSTVFGTTPHPPRGGRHHSHLAIAIFVRRSFAPVCGGLR
eukprot:TRINITY_DN11876_c0_g1_i2.p1 TRINITY_DN11876_c0_g1~~TRINITY_DN11876_c0_g1_i2.p1  ORF type:complete len:130 (-),score=6.14 TRINITY_DN11876_c0_g1_i2:821-1210(-)